MEALLPRCSAEHRELSTIRPNLIRTQSNRPELSLSIQQLYLQWSPSLKPERYGFAINRLVANLIIGACAPKFCILNFEFCIQKPSRIIFRRGLLYFPSLGLLRSAGQFLLSQRFFLPRILYMRSSFFYRA